MKSCPNCRLSFADETYNLCLQDGSPLAAFDEPEVETVIRQRKIKIQSLLSSNNRPAVISEPVVPINIAQQCPFVKNDSELYEVTHWLWRLSRQRAEKAKYAFAVFRSEIKEVYEIHHWDSARFDASKFGSNVKKSMAQRLTRQSIKDATNSSVSPRRILSE